MENFNNLLIINFPEIIRNTNYVTSLSHNVIILTNPGGNPLTETVTESSRDDKSKALFQK